MEAILIDDRLGDLLDVEDLFLSALIMMSNPFAVMGSICVDNACNIQRLTK